MDEQPDDAERDTPPKRRRRKWLGCLPPVLWILGTLASAVLGCVLGAAHYKQTRGEPNPGLYNEMRIYQEMIKDGGLIGTGVGAIGGAALLLLVSLLSKDNR